LIAAMCGRFSLSGDIDFYADYFGASAVVDCLPPSWNVAPTDQVYVIAERDGRRVLETMRWGLVPHWAKDPKSIQINARSETASTSPAFRDSFARKRCLIPADGFYEWEPAGRGRIPHWIHRADGFPVGFAGIWSTRQNYEGEWIRSCSILTQVGRGVVAPLHDRMPIALNPDSWEAWLDREITDPEEASRSLRAIDDDLWMEREVSTRVNSVRNNDPQVQEPSGQGRLI
jgi:putative SOS response-associated peptidase YedK